MYIVYVLLLIARYAVKLDGGELPTSDPTQLTPSEYYHHITLDPVIMCVGGNVLLHYVCVCYLPAIII